MNTMIRYLSLLIPLTKKEKTIYTSIKDNLYNCLDDWEYLPSYNALYNDSIKICIKYSINTNSWRIVMYTEYFHINDDEQLFRPIVKTKEKLLYSRLYKIGKKNIEKNNRDKNKNDLDNKLLLRVTKLDDV